MKIITDPSLVFSLPLHEKDGTHIVSHDPQGHPCEVTGATWNPAGRLFDGIDDFIEVPHSSSLAFSASLTVEGWIKIHGLNKNNSLCGKAASLWTETAFTLQVWNNQQVAFSLSSDGGSPNPLTSGQCYLAADRWYHVAGTFRRPDRAVFIDGECRAQGTWDDTIFQSTASFYAGKYTGNSDSLDGAIGEIRLYNRALTPAEIQRNYLATRWRYQ